MGQLKRQLVMWGAIATTTAVLPGLALADAVSPQHGGGRHGRDHRDGDAKLMVAGRAISKGMTDSYGLRIRGASGEQPTDAGGMVRFAHRGQNVMEGLVGEITCLSKDSAGIVSVTGTIHRSGKRDRAGKGAVSPAEEAAFFEEFLALADGEGAEPVRHGRDGKGDGDRRGEGGRRGGGELAGKDFALTISVAGKPQKFSQPTVADKGTLAACSGGGTPTAEVTRGGFRTREAGGQSDPDAKDDRDGRQGRRGWWRR
ncbi:MAG: hypothetical protein AB1679_05350 [Actinomycetota bacterium]|jgi:hypothetical protein